VEPLAKSSVDSVTAAPVNPTARRDRALPRLITVHQILALVALLWLSVLGLTGWILDHHEWRWSQQWTMPAAWTSPAITRLVRGTIMRKIEVVQTTPPTLVGGSERGLWRSNDFGDTWIDIGFRSAEGREIADTPQTFDVVASTGASRAILIATDDGIWILDDGLAIATPFALQGRHVTRLTEGATPTELVGLDDESDLFRLTLDAGDGGLRAGDVQWIDLSNVEVSGLPAGVDWIRFALDLHVGRGLLPQPWSTLINDYGGIALVVLSLTGLLSWSLKRRWRHNKPSGQLRARREMIRWLFRGHAPVFGILAIFPILYVSLTAFAVDHITEFMSLPDRTMLPRDRLPPIYAYRDLSGELSGVAAFPGEPQRYAVASRFGVLLTTDGGAHWAVDRSLPQRSDGTDAGRVNLFRSGSNVFVGIGGTGQFVKPDGAESWTEIKLDGPTLAITDAARMGDVWYLKNSRAIYRGDLAGPESLTDSKIPFPPLTGTPFFLFMADVHTGNVFSGAWRWVNDAVAAVAIFLALSGLVLWWRRKWM